MDNKTQIQKIRYNSHSPVVQGYFDTIMSRIGILTAGNSYNYDMANLTGSERGELRGLLKDHGYYTKADEDNLTVAW